MESCPSRSSVSRSANSFFTSVAAAATSSNEVVSDEGSENGSYNGREINNMSLFISTYMSRMSSNISNRRIFYKCKISRTINWSVLLSAFPQCYFIPE